MVNLVYQPKTLGDILAIYLDPLKPATRLVRGDDAVFIYHHDHLIGINLAHPLRLIPSLQPGIIRQLRSGHWLAIQQRLNSQSITVTLPPFFSGFRIGEITQLELHPDAENLNVCQVSFGQQTLQVVTNSTKVKKNDRIVVALPGAMLLDGQIIQEGLMMNVKSQGMFCSQKTLGIHPETQMGVYVLHSDAVIGKDFYGE